MIQFSEVSKYYEGKAVLKDITFTINKGELAYVTGPSGAGKTTLLRLIYRSEHPDEGNILVAGWDVGRLRQGLIPLLRRNIGVVFQDFRLLFDRTIFENIALALKIHSLHPREIKRRVNEALNDVELRQKAHLLPACLSGGEQQRVAIARAIVSKPQILLADEPTGNLDPETSQTIMELFKEINTKGTTVLIATHHRNLFEGTGRRVIYLKDAQIEKEEIC